MKKVPVLQPEMVFLTANRKMQRNQKLLSRTVLLLHSSLKPHQDKKNGQIGMCVTTRRAFPESETICQL